MDNFLPGLLLLPLELRQKIYESCFGTAPAPSLLHVNRLIRAESIHFIRKRQQTFTFNISGEEAGFDKLALWYFKIKGHIPRLGRMKHLILNIYPPDQDKPIEMFRLWGHLKSFCKELAAHRRIPQLTVNFVEDSFAGWVTKGVPHTSFGVQDFYSDEEFYRHDVGQILLAFSHLVNNVNRPKLILPGSIFSTETFGEVAQQWANDTEQLMTGDWSDREIREEYEDLEDWIKDNAQYIKHFTALKSKAAFERMFGRNAVLGWQDLQDFHHDYPHMDMLSENQRPRYKYACNSPYCGCDGWYTEVWMPGRSWDPLSL